MTTQRRLDALQMIAHRARLRLPVRGSQSTALLHEPMVLEIGSVEAARIGDILAFRRGDGFVAHRIIAKTDTGYRTSGDSQPLIVESVAASDVIGKVVAVWSDASATAKRIDREFAFRIRSAYYVIVRPARICTRRMEALGAAARRANPRARPRAMLGLVEIVRAAHERNSARLVRALDIDVSLLRRLEEDHRCAAYVGEVVRELDIAQHLRPDVAEFLQKARLNGLLATRRLNIALDRIVAALGEARMPFALLKGAARVHARARYAAYHSSDDIDVLVRACDLERAVELLRSRGYSYTGDAAQIADFAASHHHVCPLEPPKGEFPVELHHALARPGTLTVPLDWEALADRLVPTGEAGGAPYRFDAVGTAFHLAVHAIGLGRMRDTVLLAALVADMSAAQLSMLRALVAAERDDSVRLEASVAFAARIAGVSWICGRHVESYIAWTLRRGDMPRALAARSYAAELYYARRRSLRNMWKSLADGPYRLRILPKPLRAGVRIGLGMIVLVYARLLPRGFTRGESTRPR